MKADSITTAIEQTQLDSIYSYAAELFKIDKENLTLEPIPPPPFGEGYMARVPFDLKLRGDKYKRDVRKPDTLASKPFQAFILIF